MEIKAAQPVYTCDHCKEEKPDCRLCSKCRCVRYCCQEHQKADWLLHKPVCKPPLELQQVLADCESVIYNVCAQTQCPATLLGIVKKHEKTHYLLKLHQTKPNCRSYAEYQAQYAGKLTACEMHALLMTGKCALVNMALLSFLDELMTNGPFHLLAAPGRRIVWFECRSAIIAKDMFRERVAVYPSRKVDDVSNLPEGDFDRNHTRNHNIIVGIDQRGDEYVIDMAVGQYPDIKARDISSAKFPFSVICRKVADCPFFALQDGVAATANTVALDLKYHSHEVLWHNVATIKRALSLVPVSHVNKVKTQVVPDQKD